MEDVMVYAFNTLAHSKKLRNKGVPQDQAEAHAEAIREFVMAVLAPNSLSSGAPVRIKLRTRMSLK
jgi:hypothetical protein